MLRHQYIQFFILRHELCNSCKSVKYLKPFFLTSNRADLNIISFVIGAQRVNVKIWILDKTHLSPFSTGSDIRRQNLTC